MSKYQDLGPNQLNDSLQDQSEAVYAQYKQCLDKLKFTFCMSNDAIDKTLQQLRHI